MRIGRCQLRGISFALLLTAFLLFPLLLTTSLASSPAEPFLNRLKGSWQGDGKALGMTARLHLNWEWVLGNKFLRLNLSAVCGKSEPPA
jgi:hypothetical protein